MDIDPNKLAEALRLVEALRKTVSEAEAPAEPAAHVHPWERRGDALAAALQVGAAGHQMAAGAKLHLPAEWVEQFGTAD